MVLKKLIIENFRSYYGKKEFLFGPRLNLILGSNGDGKSTLFEAINWALTHKETDRDRLPSLKSLVSAKFFALLPTRNPQPVRVTLELFNSNGQLRRIVREFFVEKREDGSMAIANHAHRGYRIAGGTAKPAISVTDILEKEAVFPARVKKFSILQGEEQLNIFEDPTVLAELINMYSSIKDLSPYIDLAQHVLEKGTRAKANSADKKATESASAKTLSSEINRLRTEERRISTALQENRITLQEKKEKIQGISGDYAIVKLVREKQDEINKTEELIKARQDDINEDYSVRLLDELWILNGFAPIAEEFAHKMEAFENRVQEIRDEHNRKIGEVYAQRKMLQEAKDRLKESIDAMPGFMPEIETMRQMLTEHRCKYCGTEAPEGSTAFEHIKNRLDEFENKLKESLEEIKVDDMPTLELGDNVKHIASMSRAICRSLEVTDYASRIAYAFKHNEDIKATIQKARARIDALNDQIVNELANSSTGKDLMQYVDNTEEINKWYEDYGRAESIITAYSSRLPGIRKELREKQDKYDKMISNDKNKRYMDVYKLALLFSRSLDALEERTYESFLTEISNRANEYMRKITVDDFRGIITMEQSTNSKKHGAVDVLLKDNRGVLITTPNKSLFTTKCISVILALADFNQQRQGGNGYPLILDAPTSSFDAGKDKSFYQSLNSLTSQCIIVTKSFLFKDEETKQFVIDQAALNNIESPVYRIKKNIEGFDQQDLSTVETIVEPVKNIQP